MIHVIIIIIHTHFQRVKKLQDMMKSKFVDKNESEIDGIKVGFKLPDGTKTENLFTKNAVVKVSYINSSV